MKKTIREQYTELLKLVRAEKDFTEEEKAEMADFLEDRISKEKTGKSEEELKKEEELKTMLLQGLGKYENGVQIKDLIKDEIFKGEVTSQKAVAYLKKLIAEGKVEKVHEENKKSVVLYKMV